MRGFVRNIAPLALLAAIAGSAHAGGTQTWPGDADAATHYLYHLGAAASAKDPDTAPELYGGHTAGSFPAAGSSGRLLDVACGGSNFLPVWTGSAWACTSWTAIVTGAPPTGAAGGALTGTYPNPGVNVGAGTSVTGLLPVANQAAPTGTGFDHITSGSRDPAARAVDLSGADVTNQLPLTALAQGGAVSTNVLTWNGSAWVPAAAAVTGVTSVSGVAGQIVVATGTTTPVVGLATVNPAQVVGGSGISSVQWDDYGRIVNATAATFLTPTSGVSMFGQINGSGPVGAISTTIDPMGASTGQVLTWNGSLWLPANSSGGVTGLFATDPATVSSSSGAVTIGTKFDNSTITLNGGGAEQRGHISGGGLDIPAGSNTATLTAIALTSLASIGAHTWIANPTGIGASPSTLGYGSTSGIPEIVIGAPDTVTTFAAGANRVPFGSGTNGQLADSAGLTFNASTGQFLDSINSSNGVFYKMQNTGTGANSYEGFVMLNDAGKNSYVYQTNSTYTGPEGGQTTNFYSDAGPYQFWPDGVKSLAVSSTAVNLPLATASKIQKTDGSKNLVAASSSDITSAVTWPTGVLEGASSALTSFSTTTDRVLLGAIGGGVIDSANLTYPFGGALTVTSRDGSGNAIVLNAAANQFINKHGGAVELGTDDANLVGFFTANATRMTISSTGGVTINSLATGIVESTSGFLGNVTIDPSLSYVGTTLSLPATGVTAGTYGGAGRYIQSVTVDAEGRVTANPVVISGVQSAAWKFAATGQFINYDPTNKSDVVALGDGNGIHWAGTGASAPGLAVLNWQTSSAAPYYTFHLPATAAGTFEVYLSNVTASGSGAAATIAIELEYVHGSPGNSSNYHGIAGCTIGGITAGNTSGSCSTSIDPLWSADDLFIVWIRRFDVNNFMNLSNIAITATVWISQ